MPHSPGEKRKRIAPASHVDPPGLGVIKSAILVNCPSHASALPIRAHGAEAPDATYIKGYAYPRHVEIKLVNQDPGEPRSNRGSHEQLKGMISISTVELWLLRSSLPTTIPVPLREILPHSILRGSVSPLGSSRQV